MRRRIFGAVAGASLRFSIDRELPLAEAAEVRRLPKSRTTTGKILLLPPSGAFGAGRWRRLSSWTAPPAREELRRCAGESSV